MPALNTQCASYPQSTLQAILETAVDGIVVIDHRGTIQAVNRAVSTIFGYTKDQLRGEPVSVLMPEPYRSNHQAFIDRYLESGQGRILGVGEREVPGLRADGSIIPLELGVSEIASGTDHLFAAILRDISERKAAQLALVDSYLALERKQRLLDQDLEAAAKIQLSLLPHSQLSLSGLDAGWIFEPSVQIGGDIFNLLTLSPKHLGMYILDVSGHGVTAALVAVSVAQVMQREGCLLKGEGMEDTHEPASPAEVLELLDTKFPLERFGTYFTMSYLVLNIATGQVQFCNAGHPPPLLIRNSGAVLPLQSEGTVIGLGGMLPFSTASITLQPGDVLALYTDGIYEQDNGHGKQYGWETMGKILAKTRHCPAQTMAETVLDSLRRFAPVQTFDDDVSLFCLKYAGDNL